jgi:hypothetical protein
VLTGLYAGACFLFMLLLPQATTNKMINKAKNIFFITFLFFYFLSLYEIEFQGKHQQLLIFEKGLCCQLLSQVVIY